MSQSEKTFPHELAVALANSCMIDLRPFCERALVVGSVRREKPEVHDIEIVAIPRPYMDTFDLFGNPVKGGDCLTDALPALIKSWRAEVLTYGSKLKRLALPGGIVLELHYSSHESWAVETVIRTGPADFSHKVVTPRKHGGYLPSDCRIHDGWQVWRGSKLVPMNSEKQFLEFLGLGWVEPKARAEKLVPGVSVETEVAHG